MVKKLQYYLNKHKTLAPFLLLLGIEVIIFLTNYKPGTYLIGWDNIMPEFNLPLNWDRSLVSLWQGYRGLGTLDGLAHSANLVHTSTIWFLSIIFPQALLRYLDIHAMHLLGGIGMYLLLKLLFKGKHQAASILGALFYMGNLGTIQMFYAPLEVFATHFAALPFIVWQMQKTFTSTTPKNLFLLFLITFLCTPQSFVPTVFIVFLILFGALLIYHLITTRNLKQTILIGIVVFLANSFWLFPYAYSALHTPDTIRGTKINQIASEEIFYRNKAYGDILSVFSLKGFMLATAEYDVLQNKDVYFMQRWVSHTDSLLYRILYALLFLVILLGICLSLLRRQFLYLPFMLSGFISFIFLANNTFLLEQFNTWFRAVFPVFGEAFRFPFTKFITLLAFCFSIFFGVGMAYLLSLFVNFRKYIIAIASFFLLFVTFPIFQGYLTSPYLRLSLPSEYQSVFSYFKEKPATARIALLPVYTFWNWQYRTWNHRGSGFLWYGIPQPILERAFDPWSLSNEQYFNELSSAINREDSDGVKRVLRKYAVQYVLIDTTLLNTLSRQPINFTNLETFLTDKVQLQKEAKYGKILIYSVPFGTQPLNTVPLTSITQTTNQQLTGRNIGLDTINPVYIVGDDPAIVPVFPSLSTEKLQQDISFQLTEDPYVLTLTNGSSFPVFSDKPTLSLPSQFEKEFLVPVEVKKKSGTLTFTPLLPRLRVNGQTINLSSETITLRPTQVTNPTTIEFVDTKHVFNDTDNSMWTYLINPSINTVKLSDGKNEEILLLDTLLFPRTPSIIPLTTARIDNIDLIIPKVASPFTHTDLIKRHVYNVKEIPRALPEVFEKTEAVITERPGEVAFNMKGSQGELSFYLDNLYHQASYIITADATYSSGLPISFYVDNSFQKRSEFETVLAKKQQKNVFILPKTESFFQGYGFHFIAKSVGTEVAESSLSDIDLYPFPQDTLAAVTLSVPLKTAAVTPRKLTPHQFRQPTLSSYTTEAPANTLLMLAEAYDSGWKAYAVPNERSKLHSSLPFIFGRELKTHTRVNNWANAWTLPGEEGVTPSNYHLVILYLPQYLQYAGLILTFITGTCLLISWLKIRKR